MAVKLGLEGRLYIGGSGGGWDEVKSVKNLTLNLQTTEADVTSRNSGGWRATKPALKECSIEFEMVWDPDDAAFNTIRSAFFDQTALDVLVLDGPVGQSGSQGLKAKCVVLSFSRNEQLEEAMTVSVSLKPAYATEPPSWYVAGS